MASGGQFQLDLRMTVSLQAVEVPLNQRFGHELNYFTVDARRSRGRTATLKRDKANP
jgi:hypothetical protein